MSQVEIVRLEQRLNSLFKRVGELDADPELQAHWARYLCILVSGYLETAVREVYGGYAERTSSLRVARFVLQRLDGVQNANMERILQTAGAFDEQWRDQLKDITEGDLKDAVDSIVNNRNQIAHGRDTGISYSVVHDYYQRVTKVVRLLQEQCGPE
ncbi:MAG: hypothetical protein HY675_12710 [Chloroflexi bacterium]|nr:hypothetical protein [Chloroflexota bacterium]